MFVNNQPSQNPITSNTACLQMGKKNMRKTYSKTLVIIVAIVSQNSSMIQSSHNKQQTKNPTTSNPTCLQMGKETRNVKRENDKKKKQTK